MICAYWEDIFPLSALYCRVPPGCRPAFEDVGGRWIRRRSMSHRAVLWSNWQKVTAFKKEVMHLCDWDHCSDCRGWKFSQTNVCPAGNMTSSSLKLSTFHMNSVAEHFTAFNIKFRGHTLYKHLIRAQKHRSLWSLCGKLWNGWSHNMIHLKSSSR